MTYHDIIIIPEILDISDHEIESIYILNFSADTFWATT